jgi:hypothetical protein
MSQLSPSARTQQPYVDVLRRFSRGGTTQIAHTTRVLGQLPVARALQGRAQGAQRMVQLVLDDVAVDSELGGDLRRYTTVRALLDAATAEATAGSSRGS